MRYGENPHQSAAFYRDEQPARGTIATYRQLQGKELSYNNVADSDAAWECVKTFAEPACVIVKHANPCGVAIASTPLDAYRKAFATDPTSAFGGIIAFNRPVDAATVEAVAAQFLEVLIAPSYTDDALSLIAKKANVRVLEIPPQGEAQPNAFDMKRVGGGFLVQSPDDANVRESELQVVTRRAPTADEMRDLLFAWRVAKFVKSNAIVYGRDGRTLGVGAGQMSRVDSARIAAIKAASAGLSLARLGGRVRCVLPVPRRPRRRRRQRRHRGDPAGRQHARRGSDRGRRRARARDGVHRHAPFPALSGVRTASIPLPARGERETKRGVRASASKARRARRRARD